MQLYTGFDLHSNNNYLAIIDENDNRVYRKKLPNQADVILAELEPFKGNVVGIVVESTFHWYWLVDLLMSEISNGWFFEEKKALTIRTGGQVLKYKFSAWERDNSRPDHRYGL